MSTTNTEPVLPLPSHTSADARTYITPSLWFIDHDGYRVVFCRYEPIYRIALDDRPHLRFVCVMLRQSEVASQQELAHAFGYSVASLRRWERAYQQHGLAALDDHFSTGRPRKIERSQELLVRRWFLQGVSKAEIARRLGVGEATINRTCRRLGLQRQAMAAPELPLDAAEVAVPLSEPAFLPGADQTAPLESPHSPVLQSEVTTPSNAPDHTPLPTSPPLATPPDSASAILQAPSLPVPAETPSPSVPPASQQPPSVPAATLPATCPAAVKQTEQVPATFTLDSDPANRQGDRFLARQGLLADAVPLFGSAEHLPRAGIFLAVPVLVNHGVLSAFQQTYGSLHPSFYGLRTLVMTLLFMALLRIKRPENLKEYSPDDLGRILGLDRAPEVKTVRRKLGALAARQKGKQLLEALARQRIARQEEAVAFRYIDGHVSEYHGQEPLAKTKKPQSPVARTAATDYWVNDAVGSPLLVVSSEMNAALTTVLPPILQQVKALVPPGQRLTVIFDRGGFSAKLFRLLIDSGVDVITYRKGKKRLLAKHCFSEHTLQIGGRTLKYQLRRPPRKKVGRLRNKRKKRQPGETPQFLWMREVSVLREEGGQTQVLTNRTDLAAVQVVYRMFGRWRQENYFKYMEAEYALDALVEYGVEESPPEGDRPNPKRLRISKRLRQARAEVVRLQAALGEGVEKQEEGESVTASDGKTQQAQLCEQLQVAQTRVSRLQKRLKRLPRRIPASDLRVLKKEKKYVVDGIKMTAYQLETELLGMLDEHYARSQDEGRTFLHAALQACGRLEVGSDELRVTLARQSSPHRTRALAALCEQLNALNTCFPGTNLRLRLAVEPHEPLTP